MEVYLSFEMGSKISYLKLKSSKVWQCLSMARPMTILKDISIY